MASADPRPADGGPAEPAITVEVAFSPAPREMLAATLHLAAGTTIATALRATGWPALACLQAGEAAFAEAGLSAAVWGRARPLSASLRDGDRVEVLRALGIAPMDARRLRYEAAGGVKALRKRCHETQKR